jgi:hypothetical protein
MKILIALLAATCACVASDPLLPDSRLTPGAVTNVPIEILCAHGYTARPGVRHVTEKDHREMFMRYYGKVPDNRGKVEDDHLCPLEWGGSNSVSNRWPQSYVTFKYNAHTKDRLENWGAANLRKTLATQGPQATIALRAQYQREICENWIMMYEKYLGTNTTKAKRK